MPQGVSDKVVPAAIYLLRVRVVSHSFAAALSIFLKRVCVVAVPRPMCISDRARLFQIGGRDARAHHRFRISPPCGVAAFVVNSEHHTEARSSIRVCVGLTTSFSPSGFTRVSPLLPSLFFRVLPASRPLLRASFFICRRASAVTRWAPSFRRLCGTSTASAATASTEATTTRGSAGGTTTQHSTLTRRKKAQRSGEGWFGGHPLLRQPNSHARRRTTSEESQAECSGQVERSGKGGSGVSPDYGNPTRTHAEKGRA
jgi:hypothetical protein